MARTIAEAAKDKNIKGMDRTLLLQHVNNPNCLLDLTLLPPETRMKMCLLKAEPTITGDVELYVTDDEYTVCGELDVKTNDITLRQVKFGKVAPKDKMKVITFQEAGCTMVNLPMMGTRVTKKGVQLFLDGLSVNMLSTPINEAVVAQAKGGHVDVDGFCMAISDTADLFSFIGQHTISFPDKFVGREQVSFLGLPRGTILPTKNGGEFEVYGRYGLSMDSEHKVTGNLGLIAKNDKAADLATKEGWAITLDQQSMNPIVQVPSSLPTSSDRTKFMIQDIKVPYRDPIKDWAQYVGMKKAVLRTSVVTTASGDKIVFYKDQDGLAESLDKFLFG